MGGGSWLCVGRGLDWGGGVVVVVTKVVMSLEGRAEATKSETNVSFSVQKYDPNTQQVKKNTDFNMDNAYSINKRNGMHRDNVNFSSVIVYPSVWCFVKE